MDKNNQNEAVKPVQVQIIELGSEENLLDAEVYYIENDWLLCCDFQRISPVGGDHLGIGPNLVFNWEPGGKPAFIEFLEGMDHWEKTDQFTIPADCPKTKVKYVLPIYNQWYSDPVVLCDKEMKNVCIRLSEKSVTKNIQIAKNVIFGLDDDNYLHQIWLLNIEMREK